MIGIKLFVILLIVMVTFFSIIRNGIEKEKEDGVYSESDEIRRFILKFRPIAYLIFGAIVGISALVSSIYFTNEQQIGFTSMFGNNTMIDGPGMHFKVPFVSEKHVYDSTTKGMAIGYTEEDEEYQEEDSLMITSDFNFINIDFYIEYRITDPIEYCYGSDNPEEILRNVAQSAIRNTVGRYDVESVMTTGKSNIETDVFEDISNELEHHNIGITIGNVRIQDAEPPTSEVNDAFKDVESAKQNAETTINKAYEYRNTQIPAAEAKAKEITEAATATKTERVNAAKEQIAKFEAIYSEYRNNPETVKQRIYYEALQEILPNMKVIIGKDSKVIYVQGNNTDIVDKSSTKASKENSKTEKEDSKTEKE